jgi:hypothetical protein
LAKDSGYFRGQLEAPAGLLFTDCYSPTAIHRLQKSGVKNLFYIPGEHLFGDDGEGSTDGSHPNDLGFLRQADIFAQVLEPLLKTKP